MQELEDQVELVLRVDHVQQPGGARIAWAGARVGGWRPRDPPWPWLSTGVPAAAGFWHGHGSPQPWGLAWPRLPTAPGVPLTPAKAPLAQSQAHGMAGLWRPPPTPPHPRPPRSWGPWCPVPTHLTMLGWLSSLSREISRMAVLGTPSVSLRGRRVSPGPRCVPPVSGSRCPPPLTCPSGSS